MFALFALFASCSTNTVLRFDPKAHLLVVRAAFLSMLADGDGDGVAMAIRFACCCCLLLLLLLLLVIFEKQSDPDSLMEAKNKTLIANLGECLCLHA